MATIHPVILCGGSGTRLWPLSRRSYPKQFVPLIGLESLFQASVHRLSGAGFAPPVVVTNADFRFIVTEQLAAIGQQAAAVLIEPSARNTAPAVLAAALWLNQRDPEGLMLVAPSDHVIPDADAFRAAVRAALPRAVAGDLVTFGIAPDRAETGYGYLELETTEAASATEPQALRRFIEKPDASRATQMLADGHYLWNAGIFLFSVKAVLAAYRALAPHVFDAVAAAVAGATTDLDFTRLAAGPWAKSPDISIDYAIMEKAGHLAVVPYRGAWSDLGGWDAVWREAGPDARGVVTTGNARAMDCDDTLLRAESPDQQLVGLGLQGLVVVAMPDAVLVADKSRAQEVKQVVANLKATGAKQAEAFPRDHRPWGWFEQLVMGDRFQVKRIVVYPGAALSLQSHVHRSEHWIVVAGTAEV
ncbi:MAG: mannose-1-phosphate guanylyltransferase/mannose-6-phosphate isomerase, partial [Paracoccaceae bacterium]